MRAVSWFVRWFVRCLMGGFLCLLGLGPLQLAQASALVLDQAHAELTVNGGITVADVTLPFGWDSHYKGQSGLGHFHVNFDGPPSANAPWALYFYRLGNAYAVTLNGVVLEQNGAIHDANAPAAPLPGSAPESSGEPNAPDYSSDYSKIPRLVRIPPSVLLPHNLLEVTIRSDSGRRSGMPAVSVGPIADIEPLYQREFVMRIGGCAVLVMFSLVVGVFALVLWFTQTDPRPEHRGVRDKLYLFAAMTEFSWAVYIADNLIENPPLPWNWWSVVVNMALGMWLSSLLLFCQSIAGWEHLRPTRWVRRSLLALMLIGPAVAFGAVSANVPRLLTLWQAGFVVVVVPSIIAFVAQARQASTMHKVVALAFLVNVPVGLHDFYILRIADSFASQPVLRYSATLFGLALAVIAVERFRSANLRVRDMLDTLAIRVEDKEQELSDSYLRMELIAREQERVQERSRILRDMHDGVGSHISSAIRQLQSGKANPDEVLLTLQDSLDQLKLSIDALNLPPGDVTALLANLRYRLEPRFRAMGLTLEWAVVPLPEVPSLDASAMRQLQYIFFEAFSNVMQHAHASILRIEATPTLAVHGNAGHTVRIRIGDNGRGFDTTAVQRKGLASMQERARAIGAQIQISSQPGETFVDILLG